MRLILVRHGESAWNAERRMQGQADPPLSPAGRAQALALRPLVDAEEPDLVVSSDLRRARQTLALLGREGPGDPGWRESGMGDWTGRVVAELPAGDYRAWLEDRHTPDGGEAWPEMCARVVAAAGALAQTGARRALVVTHGGPVRACCASLAGLPRSGLVPVPTGSVTVLELRPAPRIAAFGVAPRPGAGGDAGVV